MLLSTFFVILVVTTFLSVTELLHLRANLEDKMRILSSNSAMIMEHKIEEIIEQSDHRSLASVVSSIGLGDQGIAVGVRRNSGEWIQVSSSPVSAPWQNPSWRESYFTQLPSSDGLNLFLSFNAVGATRLIKSQTGLEIGQAFIAVSTEHLRKRILQIFFLLVFSFGSSLALSVFFARKKAKSTATALRAFMDVVLKVTEGNDAKARVLPLIIRGDFVIKELEDLASGFDCMLDRLEEKGAQLESLVAQKTQELESSRQQVTGSSRLAALGEMASGIAHEVNNPLAVIKASAEQLLKLSSSNTEIPPETLKKLSERINRVSDRIAKIVSGLRMFAREGGGDPIERTDLAKVVTESMDFCLSRFKENGIDIKIHPFPDEVHVNGRSVQISQVLLNLLNNSHDALRAGEAEDSCVNISIQKRDAWIEIHVADNGPGIPVHLRDKVMEPFFTTKEVGKGTGLGLSISLSIMQGHRGALVLDSASNPTRFVMRFPHPNSANAPQIDALALKVA